MSDEMQFDSSLGGKQDLPERLTLLYFTSARAREIQEMKQTLKIDSSTKMVFQRLPIHMRRRIMSHNAKRLPRRLREIYLSQLAKSGGLPPKQKMPSRKYRRRPCNLIEEYAKRQRKNYWLETHIWHAKRFHMIEKWGYRLPERPCDKAFRACYRATTKHCCLQDISYFQCVEISGTIDTLTEGFKTVCDNTLGLSIGAKVFTEGKREGELVLFNNTEGVKTPIGSVNFHWKPTTDSLDRTLWIWIHSAYYSEVLILLQNCFNLNKMESRKYANSNISVKLTELDLNRFRLTGPTSFNILQSMLCVPREPLKSTWLASYLANSEDIDLFRRQSKYWNNLKLDEFPSHRILSLNILDPRHNMPKVRTKPASSCHIRLNTIIPENAASGSIWNTDIREAVKLNKMPNSKFAELRSELLVPGSELEYNAEVVPVMLIQRPGSRHRFLGYGSGWDLIVPAGWGNTFWISLVMWGARAGGLREFNSIRYESGLPPILEPDTHAGMVEEKLFKEKCRERFFRLPPNKRPNYTKLGVSQPFSINWKNLLQDWNVSLNHTDQIRVLREKKQLNIIQDFICSKIKSLDLEDLEYFIPVRLTLNERGTVTSLGLICMPKSSDLNSKQQVMEPLIKDINQQTRKNMRHNHKALLKRLRRQRVQAKRNNKIIPRDMEMLKAYKDKMQKLWLPDCTQQLRFSCSRELMGYVVSGNFSFLQARGFAIGYVTLGAIKSMELNKHRNKVLVRNITSRVYHTAILEIII